MTFGGIGGQQLADDERIDGVPRNREPLASRAARSVPPVERGLSTLLLEPGAELRSALAADEKVANNELAKGAC